MRIVFLVEGDTEQKTFPPFFRRWLASRQLMHVGIRAISLDGGAKFAKEAAQRAQDLLSGRTKERIEAVFGVLDVHGNLSDGSDAKIQRSVEEIETLVGDPRFRMFYAKFETEAWLLSDKSIFPTDIQARIASAGAPESRARPAKDLDSWYRTDLGSQYKKTVNGFNLFSRLDPDIAAHKCPHLRKILDALLDVATSGTASGTPPHLSR